MYFQTSERDDGNFELALDAEGIDYLEQGLVELRHMQSGEAIATPSITASGVSEFMLKRVPDEGEWQTPMSEQRDYSNVAWPWDDDLNWSAPREGATYDPSDDENWCLACGECALHFPKDVEMHVVGSHWRGHFPEWTEDRQDPQIQLHLVWVGLGTPPQPRQ